MLKTESKNMVNFITQNVGICTRYRLLSIDCISKNGY
jgi:hypothetical protein